MDRTPAEIAMAMDAARRTVTNTMSAAADLESVIRRDPELAGGLTSPIGQLYALADVARDVERDLAAVHARCREGC